MSEAFNNGQLKPRISKKIILAAVIILIVAVPVTLYFTANSLAKKRFGNFIEELHMPYKISWSDIKYNIFSRSLTVYDLQAVSEDAVISSKKVLLSNISDGKTLPRSITVDFENLVLPVKRETLFRYELPLKKMGYETLHGNARLSAVFNENSRQLTFTVDNTSFKDFGTFDIRLVFEDITETTVGRMLTALPDKTLSKGWLRFTDMGLVNKTMGLFAEETDTPVESVKNRILDGINRRMHTQFRLDSPQRRALGQLYRFIDAHNRITFTLEDTATVSLREVVPPSTVSGWRNLAGWFAHLPVTITSN